MLALLFLNIKVQVNVMQNTTKESFNPMNKDFFLKNLLTASLNKNFNSKEKTMKSVKTMLLMNLIMFAALFFGTGVLNPANAQQATTCYKCKPLSNYNFFFCAMGTNGGFSCTVSNGGKTCSVTGLCFGKPGVLERPYSISFDKQVFEDIGKAHPRFAATLATLSQSGYFTDGTTITWIGEDFNYIDLKYLINSIAEPTKPNTAQSPFFSSAVKTYPSPNDVPVVSHSISISEISPGKIKLLINGVEPSKPSSIYSSNLEIILSLSPFSQHPSSISSWRLF